MSKQELQEKLIFRAHDEARNRAGVSDTDPAGSYYIDFVTFHFLWTAVRDLLTEDQLIAAERILRSTNKHLESNDVVTRTECCVKGTCA